MVAGVYPYLVGSILGQQQIIEKVIEEARVEGLVH